MTRSPDRADRPHRLRPALLGLVVLFAVLGTAAPAWAHTQVQRAVPGPGERVSDTVDHVELTFLDPVDPSVTIAVTGEDGSTVAGLGPVELSPDRRQATVHFDALRAAGAYVVDYRFAGADGDVQHQSYQFTYLASAAGPDSGSGGTNTAAVAGGVAVVLVLGLGVAVALRRRPRTGKADIPDR